MQPTESAVLAAVPEAEPAVAALRARLDSSAAQGVPAHVTVLYPFVHPDRLGPKVIDALAEAVASAAAFAVSFRQVGWFGYGPLPGPSSRTCPSERASWSPTSGRDRPNPIPGMRWPASRSGATASASTGRVQVNELMRPRTG